MWYFSKSTNGFYNKEVNGSDIPKDVVVVPEHEYLKLRGKSLSTNLEGFPVILECVDTLDSIILQERVWRDGELLRADIEIYKVQDSDSKAKGSISDWRAYRKSLRGWPENKDFPNKDFRPAAPDA